MSNDLVNADFSRRVVIAADELPWLPSPQGGVERRLLDRVGGEVARATSLVRYKPASAFPAHEHALGEEFLVLEGVFSDEYGDYPRGVYVRNPPNSRHAPRTGPGCVILVKLRQMQERETARIVVDTSRATWRTGGAPGFARMPLHDAPDTGESVGLERLDPNAVAVDAECPAGKRFFLLSGDLADEYGRYCAGDWIRNPAGFRRKLRSVQGATYWVKRGHLCRTP